MGLNWVGNVLRSVTGKTETGGGVRSTKLIGGNLGYIKRLNVQ